MPTLRTKKADQGKRADVFVAENLPKFSRSSLKNLFKQGLVKIKGGQVKPGQKLTKGDALNVDTTILEQRPEAVEIPVTYENDEVIVMDKPAGILTHSKGALNTEATVASFIAPKLNDKSLEGNRAGIVHRLDRGTSGVIIAAKTTEALKALQKEFSTRKAKKTYWAIVEGTPEQKEAVIDAPIGRNPRRPQTFKVISSGKPAQTQYKVLKELDINRKLCSLLELKPLTGRTHQLRVHLSYIGHPIIGDSVYGKSSQELMNLHAKELEIRLPNGETKKYSAKLPAAFQELIT